MFVQLQGDTRPVGLGPSPDPPSPPSSSGRDTQILRAVSSDTLKYFYTFFPPSQQSQDSPKRSTAESKLPGVLVVGDEVKVDEEQEEDCGGESEDEEQKPESNRLDIGNKINGEISFRNYFSGTIK